MIASHILDQVRSVLGGLRAAYTFRICCSPQSAEGQEMTAFLSEVAGCSDHLSCQVHDEPGSLSFSLLRDGVETGVGFRGIPNGHEFTSLLLALLNADGQGKNLPDEATARRIAALKGPIRLQTYVSLTCTNCPDVVQALNVIALLHPGVTHEMVDGAHFAPEVERLHIQAVPTVVADGATLHVGRGDLGALLTKLEETFGTENAEMAETVRDYDVLVAGAGPAGTAAAIYSARKGLRVALIAGRIGGQVNETTGIENLISVPHTTGTDLAGALRQHVADYAVDVFDNRQIESAELRASQKTLRARGNETFRAPAVIIATGASWRRLNVEGEAQYIGRGVAFCPHCDGPFYKGKDVAVIGGGNSGIEAAIDLAGICRRVTVLEFAESLKADSVLQAKAKELPNVEIFTAQQTTAVVGDGAKVTGIRVKDRSTGEERTLPLDGIFVQIGLSANSAPFAGELETTRVGEISVDAACRTSLPGVYAAGDVSTVPYKQIVIAMGEGAKAALSAFDDRVRGVI